MISLRKLANSCLKISDRRMIRHFLFQIKGKTGTLPIDTFCFQSAPQQSQQLDRNAHAKSGAFDIAVSVLLDPLKLCKKFRQIFLFDTDSCIFHLKMQYHSLIRFAADSDT